MSRWKELKEAIKNPPEERLCLINANGYKMGILAIVVISLVLLQTVIWYISFIFLVQIINNWVGYKREMKQHNSIIEAKKSMGIYQEIEEDPSFTRRRVRIISNRLGEWFKYFILILVSMPIGWYFDIINKGVLERFGLLVVIIIIFGIVYLYPVYWFAQLFKEKK